MTDHQLVQAFPALKIDRVVHAFIQRIPNIDVSHDKSEALRQLDAVHREIRRELGIIDWPLATAEQIHSDKVAIVDLAISRDEEFAGYDGLITNQRRLALGIHVADCCAVYIVDPKTPAIGLIHSGKNGAALRIVAKAIERMGKAFGSTPAELIVQLSPCIRPPHYEIDFAAEIVKQCRALGVREIHDSGICTACHVDLYYSYRVEKGRTGRMLALLALV